MTFTAMMVSPKVLLQSIGGLHASMAPLDGMSFLKFHHGGKVLAQDVRALRRCLSDGRAEGKRMTALAKLLETFDAARPELRAS